MQTRFVKLAALMGTILLIGLGCNQPVSPETAGNKDANTAEKPAIPKEEGKTSLTTSVKIVKPETPPVKTEVTTDTVKKPTTKAMVKPETRSFSLTAKKWTFSPNLITVNKGDKVKLSIKSVDVTHGFSLPEFSVSGNLEPNQTINLEFTADKVGSFSFFCSVFCGEGHGGMKGKLIVQDPNEVK